MARTVEPVGGVGRMDPDRMDELARDPRFIPGIYNYGDHMEGMQEDANGSAKVAIIGIERSVAAWATVLARFLDHEDAIFSLTTLKRLLRRVDAAFPNARAFRRPGFDAEVPP